MWRLSTSWWGCQTWGNLHYHPRQCEMILHLFLQIVGHWVSLITRSLMNILKVCIPIMCIFVCSLFCWTWITRAQRNACVNSLIFYIFNYVLGSIYSMTDDISGAGRNMILPISTQGGRVFVEHQWFPYILHNNISWQYDVVDDMLIYKWTDVNCVPMCSESSIGWSDSRGAKSKTVICLVYLHWHYNQGHIQRLYQIQFFLKEKSQVTVSIWHKDTKLYLSLSFA